MTHRSNPIIPNPCGTDVARIHLWNSCCFFCISLNFPSTSGIRDHPMCSCNAAAPFKDDYIRNIVYSVHFGSYLWLHRVIILQRRGGRVDSAWDSESASRWFESQCCWFGWLHNILRQDVNSMHAYEWYWLSKKAGVCGVMSMWLVHMKDHLWTIRFTPNHRVSNSSSVRLKKWSCWWMA